MTTDHIEVMPGDGVAESIRSAGGASVPGERDIPSVNQQRSLQNRVNNLLALIVVTLVGGGFLYFYYSNLSHKQADAKAKVAQERTAKSTGEMKLPPLGTVEGPQAAPDFFTSGDIATFFAHDYEVHFNSARTGVRLSARSKPSPRRPPRSRAPCRARAARPRRRPPRLRPRSRPRSRPRRRPTRSGLPR